MSEGTRTDEKSPERDKESDDRRRDQPSDDRRRRTSAGEAPRRSSSAESASGTRSTRSKSKESKSGTGRRKVSAVQAVRKAVDQFSTLTGRAPESVVGAKWNEDHWAVRLEVVESRRIPDTADLLAEYDVELDAQGELLSYSRKDRYVRGRPTE